MKHEFGLRTAASRLGKRAVLIYLHCEPQAWPDGRPTPAVAHARHRQEVIDFGATVAGDEVSFVRLTWREILDAWILSENALVRDHGEAMLRRFAV